MSDIQLYLFEADTNKAEAQQIAQQSANKLGSGQLKLSDVIASLGEYINDEKDGAMRAKSIAYLADVLEKVPPTALRLQERRLLTDFILGRLEGDVEGAGGSARALLALEKLGRWDAEMAQKVMATFMAHTHPLRQFRLQTERYPILQLLDLLLRAHYRLHVKQLHERDPEFLAHFISYFEGEKDPRNLMIVFSLLHVPMAEWDLGGYAQDMFDAVFNYFPVTFKPPQDDPYGITAQDLKDRLRDCIAANSDFAPFAFPALLDKLDSTSMNTKSDVLVAIHACVARYSMNTINLYSVTLWDALKFEIIAVQEDALAKEALKALALIAKAFANADAPLGAYLRPIIKECNEHLEDAPTKQSQGAGRILLAVAKTGPVVADKVAKGILPTLFSLYSSTNSIAKRRALLEVYNNLLSAYLHLQESGEEINPESLQAFTNDSIQAMLHALAKAPSAEVSFRLAALKGLTKLVEVRTVLSEEQTGLAVGAIVEIVLNERIEGHGDINDEAIKSLTDIAAYLPDSIRSQAVPAFMVQIPDFAEDRSYGPVLEAFAQLSQEQQVFDTIAIRIMSKLKAARYQNAPKDYQKDLLLALLYCFTNGSPLQEDGVLRSSYFTDYAEPLVQQLREALPSQRDDMITNITGRICNIILRQQTPHFQSTIYNKNVDWLWPATTDGVGNSTDELRAFAPFLLYYHAAIRPEIAEPNSVISSLRAQSSYLLGSETDAIGFTVALQHLSLLINKFFDPKAVDKALEDSGLEVSALLAGNNSVHKLGAAFAVVKALLIQGKSGALTTTYLQLLLQNLSNTDRSFARRFAGLLAPDDILTKENHCIVSGLYKQKIFEQTIPSIIESVRTAEPSVKPNYLIAMSGILRWLPYALMESSLPSLAPSLLQSLDLNDAADQEVKYSNLTIFESLLMHDAAIAEEHSASLITRLLNSTSAPENQATVRAKALQCLSLVPRQLKREAVVPYRRPVVKKLLGCLDDGKRKVRSEAVKCRSAWLGLDESSEEEE